MGRSSSGARENANAAAGVAGQYATTAGTNTTSDRGLMLPKLQELSDHPGYTEGEKTATIGAGMGALDSAYDTGSQAVQSEMARTHNSGAGFANLADIANKRAQSKAQTATGLQSTFADARMSQQETALNDMAQMYGIDTNMLTGLLGRKNEALGIAAGTTKGGYSIPLVGGGQSWG